MIGDLLSFEWAIAKATEIARDTGLRQRVQACACGTYDDFDGIHFTIRPADLPSSL